MGNKILTEEELQKNNQPVNKTTLNGVDQATQDKMNSSFTASQSQQNAQNKANSGLDRVESLTSKDKLVSDSVWDTLNQSFTKPTAVLEADKWIASQLQKIQSGKTSYSDQVNEMMSQIMGRDKFSYDVDADPLFQQALASAMNSGKQAMQDTIGQASALTGGYGSSYATTAGNQAYNAFIEDAYNNLPQYYQMAMEAYQMEGDEMYRQLDMLTSADEREYGRNVTAYDATYQHRNQMYNEAYQQFRDAKTDAYNTANLQLSEHGQLVSDAVNYYNSASDYANTMYNREYQQWSDEVNQAMKWAEMLNSDWWNQTNFDEGVRQYEKDFAEQQRQYEKDYAQKDEHFNKNLEFTEAENQKDRDHQSSENALDRSHQSNENALNRDHQSNENKLDRDWKSSESQLDREHQASENQKDRNLTISENAKYKTGSGGDDTIGDSIPDDIAKQAGKITDSTALENFVNNLEAEGRLTEEQGEYLYSLYEPTTTKPLNERDWTLVNKGGWNWGGGIDRNGKVSDGENEYTMEQLYNKLLGSMSADEAEAYIISLQKKFGISNMD